MLAMYAIGWDYPTHNLLRLASRTSLYTLYIMDWIFVNRNLYTVISADDCENSW